MNSGGWGCRNGTNPDREPGPVTPQAIHPLATAAGPGYPVGTLPTRRGAPMSRLRLVLALVLVAPTFADETVGLKPPVANKVPHKLEYHGDTRTDDYFWIKDKKDPEVIKYLEAENAYTVAMTKRLEPLRETLYKEMLGRIKQT